MDGIKLVELAEELQKGNYHVKVTIDDPEKSVIIGTIIKIYKAPNYGIEITSSSQSKEITNLTLKAIGYPIYLSNTNIFSISPLLPDEYFK